MFSNVVNIFGEGGRGSKNVHNIKCGYGFSAQRISGLLSTQEELSEILT